MLFPQKKWRKKPPNCRKTTICKKRHKISQACTKTRNNRNETTGTKPPEPPERPEQESKMTGTTETKIEHDPNKVPCLYTLIS